MTAQIYPFIFVFDRLAELGRIFNEIETASPRETLAGSGNEAETETPAIEAEAS
jgi:hypothetical protein